MILLVISVMELINLINMKIKHLLFFRQKITIFKTIIKMVKFMRKYYLFIIKNDYYKNYKTRPHVLFSTLNNLYTLRKTNFSYGISLYNSICAPFSKNILINYIERKYHYRYLNKKIMKIGIKNETTNIQINYSCVVILTSVNLPEILKTFYVYNKKIFVCDFYNEDYFFLSDQIKKLTI